jgi:hypothetical protein
MSNIVQFPQSSNTLDRLSERLKGQGSLRGIRFALEYLREEALAINCDELAHFIDVAVEVAIANGRKRKRGKAST